ncbi:MAG: YaaC family protein [Candidatus Bathyarchaeia archaeon]|jgi:hypothetical protein
MLSYFESEYNAKNFLSEKLQKERTSEEILELAKNLSVDMQAAKEYFKAAEGVSLLTKPLLIYYGMVNLAKVLHITCKGEAPEGKKHGLESVKPWNGVLSELSVKVKQYGIFSEFYHCYSSGEIHGHSFSIKQLISQVPEVKVAYETVYKEKALSLKVVRVKYGVSLVDSDLDKFTDIEKLLANTPKIKNAGDIQIFEKSAFLFSTMWDDNEHPFLRALSGEENLILPFVGADGTFKVLPELSTHFLIMFLLGMTARYHPKVWSESIKGKKSGDIYVLQKFLEVTARKFPNLILNELRNREFFFSTPNIDNENKELTDAQLEQAYDYINSKMAQDLLSSGL